MIFGNFCCKNILWFRNRVFEEELVQDLEMIEKTVFYIQDLEMGHVEYAIARCILFLNPLISGRDGPDPKIEKLLFDTLQKLSELISPQRQQKMLMRINLCKQIYKKSIEVNTEIQQYLTPRRHKMGSTPNLLVVNSPSRKNCRQK